MRPSKHIINRTHFRKLKGLGIQVVWPTTKVVDTLSYAAVFRGDCVCGGVFVIVIFRIVATS